MSTHFQVVIVGAGPSGLSAAARAENRGMRYLLLEASASIAKTIQDYQVGKHVMAEPALLPLRSDLKFEAGSRETVLDSWGAGIDSLNLNIRFNSEVIAITGSKGQFVVAMKQGDALTADHVVLCLGLQGNLRKLSIPGETEQQVQYTLPDATAIKNETIVVVGAGDAAIENAVSLSTNNKVYIVNRRDEFARAKDDNLALIQDAIAFGSVHCLYKTTPLRIDPAVDSKTPLLFSLKRGTETVSIPCHRIIARLGAIPPRKFVESIGVRFPNENANAVPELSARYESNVEGLYVLGALAGCPLIKQAMNQGYEVIEHILGNRVSPADQPILEDRLQGLPFSLEVDEILNLFQSRIPMFRQMTALQFREWILDSRVISEGSEKTKGDSLFQKGDFSSSFYTVVDGEITLQYDDIDTQKRQATVLRGGQFFGEYSLLSGRRCDCDAIVGSDAIVIETPRRAMIKLLNSNESVRRGLDETFIIRSLQSHFTPDLNAQQLAPIARSCDYRNVNAGDWIYQEGEQGQCMYLLRSGSVLLSRMSDSQSLVFAQIPAGQYVGEAAVMGNPVRMASCQATVDTELIAIDHDAFLKLVQLAPELVASIQEKVQIRLAQEVRVESAPGGGAIMDFLMQQGLGEANDVMVIDENLCIGCDNCERACAQTHGGFSRLERSAGASFAALHIPIACRHCDSPHCMKDCPPDAIHRSTSGEVFIDQDICIGCEKCQQNCPYGVIKMVSPVEAKSHFVKRLYQRLTGTQSKNDNAIKKAMKCDACVNLAQGAACVRACPTGAAVRLEPLQFAELMKRF